MVLAGVAGPIAAQRPWPGRDRLENERCAPLHGDGAQWLRRADSATGLTRLGTQVLSFTGSESDIAFYESDRVYPPFFSSAREFHWWFDPATGAERFGAPAGSAGPRLRDIVRTAQQLFAARDTALMPQTSSQAISLFGRGRALSPLAVLSDWRVARGVAVTEQCIFREYPRVVLTRTDAAERLYLDEKTGIPVKFERIEPNYLWGQVRAEYVYSTWWQFGPVILPVSSVRYMDGVDEMRRDLNPVSANANVTPPPDSMPSLRLPPGTPVAPISATIPAYYDAMPVDTVRVASNLFLLQTPGYTHAVTMAHDTVFLFEATTGEWRSRADSVWITKLFPGHHPIALIVTDLAWPHVAGVRFWAARGATIITHTISKPFLEQVLNRQWTRTPDALETSRATHRPVIRTTSGPLVLAGGEVRVAAIDGTASEGALFGMIPAAGFVWASDYIQGVDGPSLYIREVAAAVTREHFHPMRVAAEHLPLTAWTRVEALTTPP